MRRFFVFLIFYVPVFHGILAQDLARIGELSSELKVATGIDRINCYNKIAWEYRKSHPDSMVYYTGRAIDLVNDLNIKGKLAQSYNYLGIAYHYKGEPVKSFDYYHLAMEEAIKYGDSIQYAHSLNSLGRLFFAQGGFIKSYDYYRIAQNIFEKVGDAEGLSYSLKSLSELYQTQENDERAVQMLQKALKIRLESGNIPGQISLLIDLAEIQEQNKNYDKSFDYYLKAKVHAEALNDVINIANTNIGIAHVYCMQSMYSEALIYAEKALEQAGNTGNVDLISRIHIHLGRIYFLQGKLDKAEYYYNQVLTSAKRLKNMDFQQTAFYYLSEICKVNGKIQCAYDYFRKYADVKESLNNAEVARTIERLESRIEIEKRELENEMLKANLINDQALIVRQQIYNMALIAAVLAILILVIKLWFTSQKRRAANDEWQRKNKYIAEQQEEIKAKNEMIFFQNQELQKHNQDLSELNKEKDNLMNIVAHDLKSPFNRVKGISDLLRLSGVSKEQEHYVSLLKRISKGGLNLIRDLLEVNAFEYDGRKPRLSTINLHSVLLEKMQGFHDDAELKEIELKVIGDDPGLMIHSDAVYLSRILDNLISNAIKFSLPRKSVILKTGRNQEGVFLAVKDFGQGFTEDDKKNLYKKFTRLSAQPTAGESSNGLGLAIVKIMVNRLGAEIILNSEPNKGSEFIIKFPASVEAKEMVDFQ